MGNATRKWVPLVLIAVAIAATAHLVRDLPGTVAIDLRGVLPFPLEPSADTAPRWVAVVAIPALATFVWILFQFGRTRAGLGLTRRLFPGIPEALGNPLTVNSFRPTYDTIALWVVVLVLGVHAGMIAAALGHEALAPRIISVVMGVSLIAAGNVIPRLRPNLVAGVRTRRTLTDPLLWRATHRVLGVAFVVAGAITILAGLVAPSYGLATAVVALVLACVIAAIGGVRARRIAAAAFVAVAMAVSSRTSAAQVDAGCATVRYDTRGSGTTRPIGRDPTSLTTDVFVADVMGALRRAGSRTTPRRDSLPAVAPWPHRFVRYAREQD